MKILALNLGKTTAWAVYNHTNCDKIIGGRLVYKKDPEETIKAPSKRFFNILENAYYNHDGLDEIYFIYGVKPNLCVVQCYMNVLKEFCLKHTIPYSKLNIPKMLQECYHLDDYDEQALASITRRNGYIIEDHLDAMPIIMLEYVTKKKETKLVA